MKIPFCTPALAKRYTDYLISRYGIPLSTLKKFSWIQHKENVFAVDSSWVPLSTTPGLNIFSLGLQVFANGKTFEPTSNFITLFGDHIRQNIVELPETKLLSLFNRTHVSIENATPIRVLSDGWVAVSLRGKIIASAELKGKHLIPNLPGSSHGSEGE
jgi:hypothetical protein